MNQNFEISLSFSLNEPTSLNSVLLTKYSYGIDIGIIGSNISSRSAGILTSYLRVGDQIKSGPETRVSSVEMNTTVQELN